jgi:tyrosine aminotransferase
VSFAEVTNDVPFIKLGGLSKCYGCPGWRLAWVIMYNRNKALDEIEDGMKRFSAIISQSNSMV